MGDPHHNLYPASPAQAELDKAVLCSPRLGFACSSANEGGVAAEQAHLVKGLEQPKALACGHAKPSTHVSTSGTSIQSRVQHKQNPFANKSSDSLTHCAGRTLHDLCAHMQTYPSGLRLAEAWASTG